MGKVLSVYAIALLLGGLTGFICSVLMLLIQMLTNGLASLSLFAMQHDWPIEWLSAIVTAAIVYLSWWLMSRYSPEATGSGIPEIEAQLLHERKLGRWQHLLPVKFVSSVLSISAKMVLGREGPSVHIGGHVGAMLGDLLKISHVRRNGLIAAGAAAGLAAAFNAPLAGVLFFVEELRQRFNCSLSHFKTVVLACVMSTVVLHGLLGNKPAIDMPIYPTPSIVSLSVFFLLGIFVGGLGVLYNVSLVKLLALLDRLNFRARQGFVIGVGLLVGYLAYHHPEWVGGGYGVIAESIDIPPGIAILSVSLVIRFVMSLLCYGTGVPGGIFAPMLALGTLFGVLMFSCMPSAFIDATTQQGMFAVAAMGGVFSAAVRAPITGIVLVVEMTQNYSLILPLMVTCLTATTVAQMAKNIPIYSALRRRML